MSNKRGKSINLFLMDGTASGRMKCALSNWTGIANKIPRTELEKCKDRQDLLQSGSYYLFGSSEESDRDVVYAGQAVTDGAQNLLAKLRSKMYALKSYQLS